MILLILLAVAVAGVPGADAQLPDDPSEGGEALGDSLSALADSLDADDPTAGMTEMEKAMFVASQEDRSETSTTVVGPFFQGVVNVPKAGTMANVRQFTYYLDLVTTARFQGNSVLKNTFKWSFEEYRKQDKNVQKRDNVLTYGLGANLPVIISLDGTSNWSEDQTVNTAGYANLSKRNQKRAGIRALRPVLQTGIFTHTLSASASINDQKSINQGQRNDFQEGNVDGGLQSAVRIAPGVSLAGRIYGTATSGERLLGTTTSPSNADGDSLGVGVYYNRGIAVGRVTITGANFEKKYLDFKRNTNGLIDTVGLDESQKVVDELETTDAIAYELDNTFRVGRFGFLTRLTKLTDNLNYTQSGMGLKEKEHDVMDLTLTYATGRDSFATSYDYLWKWDDQRYNGATENRGRQYNKSRDFEFNYFRNLFRRTNLNLRYHEGLVQEIAQYEYNDNDKDRHQIDFSARMDRNWVEKFSTTMVFAYQEVQDYNIRASRSSTNNVKESYEVSPGYGWTISPWLSLDQSYRVYIQYTNYSFAGEDVVNRADDYNKRGNLATKVIIDPSDRLQLTIRHDYNKRFAAAKTATDATGNAYYRRDLNQTTSKIEMGMVFRVVPGVSLEASTYRTKDERQALGPRNAVTTNYSGEMWAGAHVRRRWFKKNPLELSAMVRKYNAFGPSVTETSSDYWESDIWLKWEF